MASVYKMRSMAEDIFRDGGPMKPDAAYFKALGSLQNVE